jgi:FkbM family methyltransferase
VINHLHEKKNGYFIEFGASDGLTFSNTWLMEKSYQWQGILAEPAHHWHNALRSNRMCKIDTRCVWKDTGSRLSFNETSDPYLSSILKPTTPISSIYTVETISLSDLMIYHSAPRIVDYLSMDTEGSELEILQGFDADKGFERHSFNVITIEHNFNSSNRKSILSLLTKHGYQRVHTDHSHFDDWYLHP